MQKKWRGWEIREIEEPFSRAASTRGKKGASREVLQMKILGGAREERFIADKFMIRSALVLRGVPFRTDCSWRIKVDARSRQREGQGRRGGFEELGRQRLRVHGEAT